MLGETVNYTYDYLHRLTGVAATNASWGEAYAYGYQVGLAQDGTITFNADIFFNPTNVTETLPGGGTTTLNLLPAFAASFRLDPTKFTAADFQAVFLLHELGHIENSAAIKADLNDRDASLNNNKTVIDNCFVDKIQH